MSFPSFQEYCKDPQQYTNTVSLKTQVFWNTGCDAEKAATQVKHNIGKIWAGLPEQLEKLIESLLQPESIEILSGILGVNLIVPKIWESLGKMIGEKFSEELIANGIRLVEEEGMSAAASTISTVLTGVIDYAVLDGFADAGLYAAAWMLKSAEFFGDLIPVLGNILMALQFLQIVFDSWDPCHLDDQLDSQVIMLIVNKYNSAFRSTMIASLDSVTDSYGNIYYKNIWPIEVFAERGFLLNEKNDYYNSLQATLMTQYLSSLTVNSDGEKICIPCGGQSFNNDIWKQIQIRSSLILADNNTVIANIIVKFWPIILLIGIIIIIIIIIFLLK